MYVHFQIFFSGIDDADMCNAKFSHVPTNINAKDYT